MKILRALSVFCVARSAALGSEDFLRHKETAGVSLYDIKEQIRHLQEQLAHVPQPASVTNLATDDAAVAGTMSALFGVASAPPPGSPASKDPVAQWYAAQAAQAPQAPQAPQALPPVPQQPYGVPGQPGVIWVPVQQGAYQQPGQQPFVMQQGAYQQPPPMQQPPVMQQLPVMQYPVQQYSAPPPPAQQAPVVQQYPVISSAPVPPQQQQAPLAQAPQVVKAPPAQHAGASPEIESSIPEEEAAGLASTGGEVAASDNEVDESDTESKSKAQYPPPLAGGDHGVSEDEAQSGDEEANEADWFAASSGEAEEAESNVASLLQSAKAHQVPEEGSNSGDYEAESDAALYAASFLQVKATPKKATPKIASLPEQGYEGKDVKHPNMKSITSDWGTEYGPKPVHAGANGVAVAAGLAVVVMMF